MFEAHPFFVLFGGLVIFFCYGALTNMDQDIFGSIASILIIVWVAWAISIPDTPEEIAASQAIIAEREAKAKAKEIPREMSKADGCTVYVFERTGREHFFTRCEATTSTETNWTEGCGKGCSKNMTDTITTPNK
jgi:hypothetical protein